jgi:hypothetical protein
MLPLMEAPNGELRRQRELVAAHLRWLDEQIARSPGQPPPVASVPVGVPPPIATSIPLTPTIVPAAGNPASAASTGLPDAALPEIDPGSIRNEVRRGCFIYIIIVTVLLAASIAVAVWIGGES